MSKNNSTTEERHVPAAHTALAEHITAILEDPHTPSAIRDALWDQINELSNETQISHITPEVLRVVLPLMLEKLSGKSDAEHMAASEQTTGEEHTREGKACAGFDYQPVTPEQAERLTDTILRYDDDEAARAFIRLLHGLVHAHYDMTWNKTTFRHSVEGLVISAARRAYALTSHCGGALEEFAMQESGSSQEQREVRSNG